MSIYRAFLSVLLSGVTSLMYGFMEIQDVEDYNTSQNSAPSSAVQTDQQYLEQSEIATEKLIQQSNMSLALLNPDGSNYDEALRLYTKYITDLTAKIDFLSTKALHDSSVEHVELLALKQLKQVLQTMHKQSFIDMIQAMNVEGEKLSIPGFNIPITTTNASALYDTALQALDTYIKTLDPSSEAAQKVQAIQNNLTRIKINQDKTEGQRLSLAPRKTSSRPFIDFNSKKTNNALIENFLKKIPLESYSDTMLYELESYSLEDRLLILNYMNTNFFPRWIEVSPEAISSSDTVLGMKKISQDKRNLALSRLRTIIMMKYNKMAQPIDRIALEKGVFVLASPQS